MKTAILAITILGVTWFFTGCSKEVEESSHAHGESHAHETHLCPEHGVPEAECVRCNPSLVSQLKEKVDWCQEHDFPESQCDICNPSLKGRVSVSPESQSLAGIKTRKVDLQALTTSVSVAGKVTYNQGRLSHITSRVAGRIEEVHVFLHSKLNAGESLVSLYSPEYLTAQSEYLLAAERAKKAGLLPGDGEERTERSIFASARRKLTVLGVTEEEIARLERTREVQPYLSIRAPFSGTIVEGNAVQGDYVQPETILYRLAGLSAMWVVVDVYEKDISRVKVGQRAEITVTAYPNQVFEGRVTVAGDVLDQTTRTFKVRIECQNPDGKLKPEMFVSAIIHADSQPALALPKGTVLVDGFDRIVFVSQDENTFERRNVRLGRETDLLVEVIEGLSLGDVVVTEGSFLLKSELLKSKMGAGCAE